MGELENGDFAVGVINWSGISSKENFVLKLSDLGLNGSFSVRDLWQHKDIGTFSTEFTIPKIGVHEIKAFRLSKS